MEEDSLQALFYYGTIEKNWLGHIMAEVYKEQVYRPYLPLERENTIAIDIGANIGIVSLYLSRYFEKVISLEPSKNHFDALSRNLVSNNITNVTPINKALFIQTGEYDFGGPPDNKTMRSLHAAVWDKGKADEKVQTITLDELFEEQNIDHVDLLKLDVEGSEVEIVSSKGFAKVADKIKMIVGEQHSWSGRHANQLKDALKSNGFTVEMLKTDASLFVARR